VPRSGSKTLRYEIRVNGRLSDDELGILDGLVPRAEPVGTTLVGDLADRAALHGVLHRLRELGVELLEVRRVPNGGS
jgi:hypothetical protein